MKKIKNKENLFWEKKFIVTHKILNYIKLKKVCKISEISIRNMKYILFIS